MQPLKTAQNGQVDGQPVANGVKQGFRERKESARANQRGVPTQLSALIQQKLREVEAIEADLNRWGATLVDPGTHRRGATRSVHFVWRSARSKSASTLDLIRGPVWRIERGGEEESSSNRPPNLNQLRRVHVDTVVEPLREARQQVVLLQRRREALVQQLEITAQRIAQWPPRPCVVAVHNPIPAIARSMPERLWPVLEERRARCLAMSDAVRTVGARIGEIEEAIEDGMIRFNTYGKRNRNLIVRWNIRRTSLFGPVLAGPACIQLFKSMTGRRYTALIGELSERDIDWSRVQGAQAGQIEGAGALNDFDGSPASQARGRRQKTVPRWVLRRAGQARHCADLQRIFQDLRELARERVELVGQLRAIGTAIQFKREG